MTVRFREEGEGTPSLVVESVQRPRAGSTALQGLQRAYRELSRAWAGIGGHWAGPRAGHWAAQALRQSSGPPAFCGLWRELWSEESNEADLTREPPWAGRPPGLLRSGSRSQAAAPREEALPRAQDADGILSAAILAALSLSRNNRALVPSERRTVVPSSSRPTTQQLATLSRRAQRTASLPSLRHTNGQRAGAGSSDPHHLPKHAVSARARWPSRDEFLSQKLHG